MDGLSPRSTSKLVREFLNLGPLGLVNFITGKRLDCINDENFFDFLLSGYSLVRWGDGETALARGKAISYQRADQDLRAELLCLLRQEIPRVIYGLPWAYTSSIFSREWNLRLWKIFLSTRIFLGKHLDFDPTNLVDTEIWYRTYLKLPDLFKSLKASGRTLCVIANQKEFLNICPDRTLFIEIPNKNSFDELETIELSIRNVIQNHSNITLLLAAGPTAKAIVRRFASVIQVIDVGHGFDFYFKGYKKYAWISGNSQ